MLLTGYYPQITQINADQIVSISVNLRDQREQEFVVFPSYCCFSIAEDSIKKCHIYLLLYYF
jgi:hypothetical protein